MQFTSTRNNNLTVSFSQAVRDCIPDDGGVFVPSSIEDMRRWIYYIDETTPFASIDTYFNSNANELHTI